MEVQKFHSSKISLDFPWQMLYLFFDILVEYLINFSGLHFFSCIIHTQGVVGPNPAAPPLT